MLTPASLKCAPNRMLYFICNKQTERKVIFYLVFIFLNSEPALMPQCASATCPPAQGCGLNHNIADIFYMPLPQRLFMSRTGGVHEQCSDDNISQNKLLLMIRKTLHTVTITL